MKPGRNLSLEEMKRRVKQVDDYLAEHHARGEKMNKATACKHFNHTTNTYTYYVHKINKLEKEAKAGEAQISMFDARLAGKPNVPAKVKKAPEPKQPSGTDELLKAFMDQSSAQQRIIQLMAKERSN